MGSRIDLQYLLEGILGSTNVYYNAPDNEEMSYPAIIYAPSTINTLYANNKPYISKLCYSVMVIGELPNDKIVQKILELPMCSFNRHYISDGLNHDVLLLYY